MRNKVKVMATQVAWRATTNLANTIQVKGAMRIIEVRSSLFSAARAGSISEQLLKQQGVEMTTRVKDSKLLQPHPNLLKPAAGRASNLLLLLP